MASRLTSRQKQALARYANAISSYRMAAIVPSNKPIESKRRNHERKIRQAERSFLRTLGSKKRRLFNQQATPYLLDPHNAEEETRFDPMICQRFVVQRAFELGWTVERFGLFDQNASAYRFYGRQENKPERIGKKYQWIALHEFLARVADNYQYRGEPWTNDEREYEGPWQLHIRDIDPSVLVRKTMRADCGGWWCPVDSGDWALEKGMSTG